MPPWLWGVAFGVVAIVGAIDLTLTVRRRREPSLREAALCTLGVVALGALFGATLAVVAGSRAASQFYAGWLTEYSLSLDNLFVFVLLIGRSAVPAELRSRVLLLGIGMALVLRAVFIAAGAAALNRFDWVLYVFGAILLFTAARLAFTSATEHGGGLPQPDSAGPKIFGRQLRMRSSRAPFLALVGAIAVTDLVFALLGLRHLYFLIGGLLNRLVHLSAGLAVILGFIGFKLVSEALLESGVHHVGPVPVPHISTDFSLLVIASVLVVVTTTSLLAGRRARRQGRRPPGAETDAAQDASQASQASQASPADPARPAAGTPEVRERVTAPGRTGPPAAGS